MESKDSTVVIISGGLDSTVLAYSMNARANVHLVSFDYGQRHAKELSYAELTALKLGLRHDVVDLNFLGKLLSGSALTDPTVDVPEGHYADESMKLTIVPNRNAIMLAIAFGIAGAEGASAVAYAAHAGDHPVYPDCRPEFVNAMDAMEAAAFGPRGPALLAPFIDITKADIVKLGADLSVPFEDTWSCYQGREVHCSTCGTCVERREAFILAGIKDPTVYELSDTEFKIWWEEYQVREKDAKSLETS